MHDKGLGIKNDPLDEDDAALEETTAGIDTTIDPEPPRRAGLRTKRN